MSKEKKLTLEELDQSGAVVLVGGRIVGKQMFLRIMAEMREYKTIEKELGMPLDKFFMLVNKKIKRVYYKPHNMTHPVYLSKYDLANLINYKFIEIGGLGTDRIVLDLKDYGKTWALTKEELL